MYLGESSTGRWNQSGGSRHYKYSSLQQKCIQICILTINSRNLFKRTVFGDFCTFAVSPAHSLEVSTHFLINKKKCLCRSTAAGLFCRLQRRADNSVLHFEKIIHFDFLLSSYSCHHHSPFISPPNSAFPGMPARSIGIFCSISFRWQFCVYWSNQRNCCLFHRNALLFTGHVPIYRSTLPDRIPCMDLKMCFI